MINVSFDSSLNIMIQNLILFLYHFVMEDETLIFKVNLQTTDQNFVKFLTF